MSKYLDVDLDNGKITGMRMKEIEKRIYNKYGIDVKEILNDKMQLGEVRQKIMPQFSENTMDWLKKTKYQEIDKSGLVFPVEEMFRSNDCLEPCLTKDEPLKPCSENEIIGIYNKLMKAEKVSNEKYANKISFGEWKQQIEYFMSQKGILQMDYEIQCLLRLKYSLRADERYSYNGDGTKGGIHVLSRLSSEGNLPVKNKSDLPDFTRELQDVLFTQKYARMFEFGGFGEEHWKQEDGIDITRYSFNYVEEIFNEVQDAGLENIYYLDDVMGISLTNTIFNYIIAGTYSDYVYKKEEMKVKQEIFLGNLFDIIKIVSKWKYLYGRNLIAQSIFRFLYENNFEEKIVSDVYEFLNENFQRYLEYNKDLYDIYIWLCFYDIDDWKDEDKEKFVQELENVWGEKIKKTIIDGNIKEVIGEKQPRIKKMETARKPSGIYAQIHRAVMQGIWESKIS